MEYEFGGNVADDILSEIQRRAPDAPQTPPRRQQQQAPQQLTEEQSEAPPQNNATVSLSERKERLMVYLCLHKFTSLGPNIQLFLEFVVLTVTGNPDIYTEHAVVVVCINFYPLRYEF